MPDYCPGLVHYDFPWFSAFAIQHARTSAWRGARRKGVCRWVTFGGVQARTGSETTLLGHKLHCRSKAYTRHYVRYTLDKAEKHPGSWALYSIIAGVQRGLDWH